MPLFLSIQGFWVNESSEYARVTKGSEYAWKVPEYFWLCLNITKYAGVYVNMPKSVWMAFVLHLPIVIPRLLERVIIYFNVYTKLTCINNQINNPPQ